jgi:hypothetical protein
LHEDKITSIKNIKKPLTSQAFIPSFDKIPENPRIGQPGYLMTGSLKKAGAPVSGA